MSLSLGELVGYVRADDGQFVRALDASDHRMALFQRQTDGTLRRVADDFGHRGTQAGRGFRDGIDETLASLHPNILIDADSEPANEEVRLLYQRLRTLRDAEIGVDIPPERALAELEEIRTALAALSATHADPTVVVNTRDGEFAINQLQRAIADVDRANPVVRVRVDGDDEARIALRRVDDEERRVGDNDAPERAGNRFGFLTSALRGVMGTMGGVAASGGMMAAQFGAVIPIVAALVTTLLNIAPAAAVGATALFAMQQATAVVKLGTSGMGSAFKAAFADAKTSAGGAAGGANSLANAVRQVKQATEQAALANQRAARATESAERSLSDAKKAALQTERDLTQARMDATRALEDQNARLEDAQLNQRQAVFDVADAEKSLKDLRATGASEQSGAMQKAQLDLDRAKQRLEEQQVETKRLKTDTDAANKAGVDGSKIMTGANQRVADSHRTVQDQVRALKDAQAEQARTATAGLDAIRQAQQAVGASAGGAAGGVNALAAAMAKLSPNAQAFVRQVIALRPAWDSMKLAVQDRLFAGLAGTLQRTAGSVLPVLRTHLLTTADALNAMGKGVMNSAREMAEDGTLGKAMGSASKGLSNLSGIPGMFVKALTQLAAAAGPAFEAFTKTLGTGAAALGDKLSAAFKDGRMKSAIDTAIGLIKELAGIAGNVGSIIMSVMGAAQGAGGGFLGVIKEISGQLARAFNSPEVQGGLRSLFTTMAVLGKTVAPLLGQALMLIAPILEKLGPPAQTLIKALGVGLKPIIATLGLALISAAGAVGKMVDAAAPLLPIMGKLVSQWLPMLTPLLDAVGAIFVQLAPVIADVADQLGNGGLQPVFDGLAAVVSEFVSQGAAQFMTLLRQLLPLVPQLVPYFVLLGQSIGDILVALAPLLPQISLMSVQLLGQLLPALIPLVGPLTQLSTLFLRLATGVLVGVVIPAIQLVVDFFGQLRKMLQPGIDAIKWLTTGISHLFEALSDHLVGHSVIPDMIRSIVGWFAGLPGKAWNALSSLPGNLATLASRAASSMIAAVKYGVDSAVWWLARLPGAAWTVLSGLGRTLYDSGAALIGGFVDGMWSKAQGAIDAAKGILSNVKDFFPNSPAKRGPFSGAGWTLHSGRAVMEDWAAGMTSRHGIVADAVATAAGLAQQGLGGVGSPTASLVSAPGNRGGGFAGGGFSSGSRSGGGTLRIVIDTAGGHSEMKNLIRKITRVEGGDVQTVFGT